MFLVKTLIFSKLILKGFKSHAQVVGGFRP